MYSTGLLIRLLQGYIWSVFKCVELCYSAKFLTFAFLTDANVCIQNSMTGTKHATQVFLKTCLDLIWWGGKKKIQEYNFSRFLWGMMGKNVVLSPNINPILIAWAFENKISAFWLRLTNPVLLIKAFYITDNGRNCKANKSW